MLRLSKWYLDCVTDAGDAAILYWASLGLGGWHVRYGATLLSTPENSTASRYTLQPGPVPAISGGRLDWHCPTLDSGGTWTFGEAALERTLLDGPLGSIRWHCASPRAEATVRVGGRTLEGLGYVECLTMTLAPWRLPIARLRWGRFHSREDTIVWIDWGGPLPRSWVFVNGVERVGPVVSATDICFPEADTCLKLEGGRVLRSGRLRQTALRSVRAMTAVLPRWRGAREDKRLSRGTLLGPRSASPGWALHEEVVWP